MSTVNNLATRKRDYGIDNIRFFLIFLVVFGHFITAGSPFPNSDIIYNTIYTFHMPIFLFLFGYNAKYNVEKIISRWVCPYFVFQFLYLILAIYVLGEARIIQWTEPYWLCWYLLVCIFYQLLIPVYENVGKDRPILILLFSVIISFIVGYDLTLGTYMTLSRFWLFQPWFLLGYFAKQNNWSDKFKIKGFKQLSLLFVSFLFLVLLVPSLGLIPRHLLLGDQPYLVCGGTGLMRLAGMIVAVCMFVLLFLGFKPLLNRKIPVITYMGQNALPVFLLHGFAVKLIAFYCPSFIDTWWKILIVSVIITFVLANSFLTKIVYYMGFSWLPNVLKKKK